MPSYAEVIATVRQSMQSRLPFSLAVKCQRRYTCTACVSSLHQGASQDRSLGDNLLVMNSLLAKEGMAGKVQMVYIDPPYECSTGSYASALEKFGLIAELPGLAPFCSVVS